MPPEVERLASHSNSTTIHERPDDAWSFDLDSIDSNILHPGCRKTATRVSSLITPRSGEPREPAKHD